MYRTVVDWGLFRLPIRLFQRPMYGFTHGAFILINGGIENAVTWDTSCVTEDFWFGIQVCNGLNFQQQRRFSKNI